MPFYRRISLRYALPLVSLLLAGCATNGDSRGAVAPGLSSSALTTSAPTASAEQPPPSALVSPSAGVVAESGDVAPPRRHDEGNAVFFPRGSAVLDDAAIDVLRVHAERLRDDPRLKVLLVGHSDHLGSRSFNLAIAEQRTAVVKAKLREFGVQARQIAQRSYGNEKPGASCQSESCRQKMRRVDLVYPKPKAERRVVRPK